MQKPHYLVLQENRPYGFSESHSLLLLQCPADFSGSNSSLIDGFSICYFEPEDIFLNLQGAAICFLPEHMGSSDFFHKNSASSQDAEK